MTMSDAEEDNYSSLVFHKEVSLLVVDGVCGMELYHSNHQKKSIAHLAFYLDSTTKTCITEV